MSGAAAEHAPAGARTKSPGWPRTALLSLSDKQGAVAFARALAAGGTRIIASGGTAAHLSEAGLDVTPLERTTGFAELLGGRVKTLHPHVHAPILARRDAAADLEALERLGLEPIDLVAVNLYPFEARAGSLDDAGAVEEIDIGGVALLRAAAKNHGAVIVVHDPSQYDEVMEALRRGGPNAAERRAWAVRAFARPASYDAAIAAELERRTGATGPPAVRVVALERVRTLRYGENPHQEAALYRRPGAAGGFESLREGKELSYNNLLDLEAAVSLVWRFEGPACVIVKHNQPCGAACADTVEDAYGAAHAGDPLSAFGGIVAFNRPLDGATARDLAEQFVECVAAPEIAPEAGEALKSKKNIRVLRVDGQWVGAPGSWGERLFQDWALLQRDPGGAPPGWRVVTRRAPDEATWAALRFAWEVAAAARSNAIAIVRGARLIGLGSGQTSRVDAVDLAVTKARRAGHDLAGATLASDGFFPFPDGVTHAADAGITAVVQPGGSVRDKDVIAAADEAGVAMVFTGRRTFRH